VDKLVHPAGFVRVDELRTQPDKELDNIGPSLVQILWHILFPEEELVGGTSAISGGSLHLSWIESPGSTDRNYQSIEEGREDHLQIAAYWSQIDDFDNIIVDEFEQYPKMVFPYEPGFRFTQTPEPYIPVVANPGRTYIEIQHGREDDLQVAAYWSQIGLFRQIQIEEFTPGKIFPYVPGSTP